MYLVHLDCLKVGPTSMSLRDFILSLSLGEPCSNKKETKSNMNHVIRNNIPMLYISVAICHCNKFWQYVPDDVLFPDKIAMFPNSAKIDKI